MGISKVVFGSNTLIDISGDTVTAATLQQGYTAHGADGEAITGTLVPGGGGEPVEEDDVNFYDYDGTLVASYSATDFANLSALPPNPSHAGLTAQGWNWSLSDAKTYVAAYGVLDIGQMYTTDDGTTRLYCHFYSPRLTPYIRLYPNGTVSIDWGDNSTPDTLTGSSLTTEKAVSHTYAAEGDYTITLTPVSGTVAIKSKLLSPSDTAGTSNSRVYCSCIKKIELGPSVLLGDYALENCGGMETITLPNTLTALSQFSMQYCANLVAVVIPSSVTSVGRSVFVGCYCLRRAMLPNTMSSLPRALFDGCAALPHLVIPSSVTSFGIAPLQACSSLKWVIIPTTVTSVSTYAFSGCRSIEKIVFPSGATSFGSYFFSSCEVLKEVVLPNTTTKLDTYCFSNCQSLPKLTLPASLTTINNYCFSNCYGLKELHFKPAAPPAVSNANAFTNLPTDCVIYVPTGKLNDYKTASNYPNPNTYTYVEE